MRFNVLERKGLNAMLSGAFKIELTDGTIVWRHEYKRRQFVPGKPQVAYDDYPLDKFGSIEEFAAAMNKK